MSTLSFRSPGDALRWADTVQAHLVAGGILAYPTETVYGLGTSLAAEPLTLLASTKGRDESKPFLLLHADPRGLPGLHWTPVASALAEAFWPGPLTLALHAEQRYPAAVRSASGTIAVRDTPLPSLRTLLQLLAAPLTSTSANLPGAAAATTLTEVLATVARFPQRDRILVLDGGDLPPSPPSSLVDCTGERARLLREGAIPLGRLRTVLRQRGFVIDVD